ncbi:MAG: CAP domain-containing protein, partial [Candidatus Poseidoniia archaeon]
QTHNLGSQNPRDPELLLHLDSLVDQKDPLKVAKKFTEDHDGLSLAQLEKEWKDFWTEASPVLKAIRNNTEPLSAVSKDVNKWLQEFNKARKALISTDVTWSTTYSTRCSEHAAYLAANEDLRGPDHEQMQDVEREAASHAGDLFAEMALISTSAKKPRDVFKEWLDYPGYRDAMLNNRQLTVGLFTQEEILVMDVIRGVGRAPQGRAGTRYYPGSGRKSVPTKVAVADLGPEVVELLEKNGHAGKETLGYPISLHHFGIGGLAGNRDSYSCKVSIQGKAIEGIIHTADGGAHRRTSAPGMVVFYPLEPLKKGQEVRVIWTYEDDDSTARKEIKFNT